MKILHIIGGDLSDGAARGAYWLHCGLLSLGVESKVLTNSFTTLGDPTVITVSNNKIAKLFTLIRNNLDSIPLFFYRNKKKVIFSSGFWGFDFTRTDEYKWADIIHLHWINGFVNMKHLSKIKKPIIWTLRDMWPMTGGCHVATALECENYKTGCGNCKQLGSKYKYDLSKYILNRKKKWLPKTMKIVGISNWISEEAKKSLLFKDFDIGTIYNNVNTEDFFPVEKKVARDILGLSALKKKIILAGATNLSDFYKGFGKYLDALKSLDKEKYFLCFFGNLDKNLIENMGFEYKNFGYLNDLISLRLVYSAADVFVAPSLMDAFGKTLVESMACGTPVVCFDATGPKDIVTHKVDGYKAIPFESKSLAEGIEWVLNSDSTLDLSNKARESAVAEFDSKVISGKYVELYKEVLS